MSFDEMKEKLADIAAQIDELEQTEQSLYAELGKKVMPELDQDSEHAPLAEKIKETTEKISELRRDEIALDEEYQEQIKACTCLYCDALNSAGSAFCEQCGKKLGEIPPGYCTECGWKNDPNMNFCGKCGAKLAKQEEQ